jgi:hypothetical protein
VIGDKVAGMSSIKPEGSGVRFLGLRLLRTLLFVPAFALMWAGLYEPVRGEHTFRQSHIAANIEKYIANGLSLTPTTYNLDVPAHLFGFPAYQLAVAWICRTFSLTPLPVARAFNIVVLALVLLATDRLLAASRIARSQRLFVALCLTYSPLNLYYFQVPISDPLAILAGVVSLLGYVHWDRQPTGKKGACAFGVLLAGGVLATLIKNPAYLPFCIAIAWHRWRQRGWRALITPGFLVFGATLALTVIGFQLFSNAINHPGGLLTAEEANAFGTRHWYFHGRAWLRIATSFSTKVAPPVGFVLALIALAIFARRAKARDSALHAGLMIGVVATLLIFFNHQRQHDYYQLPFVLAFAFFAGYALHLTLVAGRAVRREGFHRLAACAWPLTMLLVLFSSAEAYATFRSLLDVSTDVPRARGAWVREHTRPDDFVIFVTEPAATSWNPEHLYYAQRDGYNLPRRVVNDRALSELERRFRGRYGRVLVFVPQAGRDNLTRDLVSSGANEVARQDDWAVLELPSERNPPATGSS